MLLELPNHPLLQDALADVVGAGVPGFRNIATLDRHASLEEVASAVQDAYNQAEEADVAAWGVVRKMVARAIEIQSQLDEQERDAFLVRQMVWGPR